MEIKHIWNHHLAWVPTKSFALSYFLDYIQHPHHCLFLAHLKKQVKKIDHHHPQKIGVNMNKKLKPPPKPPKNTYTQKGGRSSGLRIKKNEVRYDFASFVFPDPIPYPR